MCKTDPVFHITNSIDDHFDYLGAIVSWRWSWDAAWRVAIGLAHYRLDCMQRGGLQNSGYSLADQLDFARAKVACHFNYISAVTGAGGHPSTAPWSRAEVVWDRALRTIAGYNFANTHALKIEAGVWDQQTRIDMLLLRFWCKILTTNIDHVSGHVSHDQP